MIREKTNSITHLVKIVASEVFDIDIKELESRVFNRCMAALNQESFINDVQLSLKRAGEPWPQDEDELLVREVEIAIKQIAKNHKRSVGAIESRINQKGLI